MGRAAGKDCSGRGNGLCGGLGGENYLSEDGNKSEGSGLVGEMSLLREARASRYRA